MPGDLHCKMTSRKTNLIGENKENKRELSWRIMADLCKRWGNNVRGPASHQSDWLSYCFISSLNSFHQMDMFSAYMHVSILPGWDISGKQQNGFKEDVAFQLWSHGCRQSAFRGATPLLPDPTLINLHSYKDLMRHFRKSLILWGIHVVTRYFNLLTRHRSAD